MSLLTSFVDDESGLISYSRIFNLAAMMLETLPSPGRVLLLRASNGVDLDIALGALPFEGRCIERASPWILPEAARLLTCSAEDLIVHKAFASRDIDWLDVERILMRQGGRLNLDQIFEELVPLAELKEDFEIVPKLKALMSKRDVR